MSSCWSMQRVLNNDRHEARGRTGMNSRQAAATWVLVIINSGLFGMWQTSWWAASWMLGVGVFVWIMNV